MTVRIDDSFTKALSIYRYYNFQLVPLLYGQKIPAIAQLEPYFSNRIESTFELGKHNIGVITGAISRLIVIDIDSDEAKAVFLNKITQVPSFYGKVSSTLGVTTAKGLHFYLGFDLAEFPDGIDTTVLFNGNNGEIRVKGNRGYVVAPPSLHPSGKVYTSNGKELQTIAKVEWEELTRVFNVEGNGQTPIGDLFKPDTKIYEGNNRHEALMRVMESLLKRNAAILDIGAIKRMAKDWNDEHCIPPLPEPDFDRQWIQALRFVQKKGVIEQGTLSEELPIPITEEITKEISFDQLANILESTIKKDYEAKVITFNAMLLAQTDSDMINIGFQSDSSTGKTYTATECAKYFPELEVMKLFNVSKTAFFYDRGSYDKETGIKTIDLEGKILIFLDQPHYTVLETLRPLLSHDDKIIYSKITNKDKSGANRTQNIVIKGFFTVIYCSANKRTDEQEQTRLLFLSAASDKEKLEESIGLSFIREADKQAYEQQVRDNPERQWLKQRVLAIRESGIRHITVPNAEIVKKSFLKDHPHLLPRHQRDVQRIFDFVKASALLNCFNRERVDEITIKATEDDIRQGYALYKRIEQSNELGLSPAVFEFWQNVVIPVLSEVGATRKDIARQYLQIHHKTTSKEALGRLLEELENRGLITQEPDPDDRRKMLIYSGISSALSGGTNNGN